MSLYIIIISLFHYVYVRDFILCIFQRYIYVCIIIICLYVIIIYL